MPIQAKDKSSVLIDKVIDLIESKLPKTEAKQLAKFARDFYGSVSMDDLADRIPSDLYASILSLWNFIQQKGKTGSKLRVMNPDFEKHGWQSKHTIIEILNNDMSFLVDSVRMELNRLGLTTHLVIHLPLEITRNDKGKITQVTRATAKSKNIETPMYIEVDRQSDEKKLNYIKEQILSILNDVQLVVSDWAPIKKKLSETITELKNTKAPIDKAEQKEAIEFLNWISNNHFTLMGYSENKIVAVEGDYELQPVNGQSLGLQRQKKRSTTVLSTLPSGAQRLALNNKHPLVLTKTSTLSTVHRPAYVDYIGVKRFNDKGKVIGERRFIGLYTSEAYNMGPRSIPVLRRKLNWVMENSGLTPGGHDTKALSNILETYPRDELFQVTEQELLDTSVGILHMQERPIIRLFIRRDPYGRFFSCLVYVPRDQYSTKLRMKMMDILGKSLGGNKVTFNARFSESIHARTHYIIYVDNAESVEFDPAAIERELRESARSWEDNLADALKVEFGEEEGLALFHRYEDAFPAGYKAEATPLTAVLDIKHMEILTDAKPLSMILYRPQEDTVGQVRFKLFHRDKPASLSDVLPMLENMGLNVIEETPYKICPQNGATRWVLDFNMIPTSSESFELENIKDNFQQAFYQMWMQKAENDGFNRLVLSTGMNWREVSILRAIAKYLWQIGFTFSQSYIETTFAKHPTIARMLVRLFEMKFEPTGEAIKNAIGKGIDSIQEALTTVSNLDEDRIINRYVEVIQAIVRTNYYQRTADGEPKPQFSFKLQPEKIAEIPKPVPMYEIFVYSPRFEGLHLRFGPVARGGLRWSDRREDFRTEILGLVKAQQVKNSVIVPVGSKGGFVCKMMPTEGGREAFFAEGQACYRSFIRGLLDITDNIIEGKIVPPENVIRHEGDDPYLVVAADKGTATFSDIANGISAEYNFWLGDAFASGGSQGYDHKKMGITARGAWESVKRHFRDIGINCQKERFTCVAVGDMSGDVFGNGMLLSKYTALVVAFNHLHIFIDPNPDLEKSFKERQRLFDLPRSSWTDFNKNIISEGGGIFERSAKSIPLSAEMQKLLDTKATAMTPNDLIKTALQAKIDLFWNGGIGTYVKAESETNNEVGDRANDSVRINGKQLRCKIVGEGGNLGLTQLGRIEYMLNGGRGNTDFIDNVGGVDCSDHEVNIKILLNAIVASGDLTLKQRNLILTKMTDDVGKMVLRDNYAQIQSISLTENRAAKMNKELMRFIHTLERNGRLDRKLEFLPSDEELLERLAQDKGLTRAELAVLTAYGKMALKEELAVVEITDNAYFNKTLINYFPVDLRKKYAREMQDHRLRGPIIATQVANEMVNVMGSNFAHRMNDETGMSFADIAICFTLSKEIFGISALWKAIEALDNKVPSEVQVEMMYQSQRVIRRATRWFLRHRRKDMSIEDSVKYFRDELCQLEEHISEVLETTENKDLQADSNKLVKKGVPKALASRIAYLSTMFSSLDIVELTKATGLPVNLVAEVYYKLGASLQLHWFLNQITQQPVDNHWQAFARSAFREELDWQQRGLTLVVLQVTNDKKTAKARIETWMNDNEVLMRRWMQMVADFRATSTHEFAKFSVALRELLILVQSCTRESEAMMH